MSQLSSQQFKQLPMFMTPAEAGQLRSNDYRHHRAGEITTDMRDGRELESDGYRGARDSAHYITRMERHHKAEGGVAQPIHVWHDGGDENGSLVDGHHRVAASQKTGHLLPVVHHEGGMNDVLGSAFLGPTADPEMRQQFGHRGDSRPVVATDPFIQRLKRK